MAERSKAAASGLLFDYAVLARGVGSNPTLIIFYLFLFLPRLVTTLSPVSYPMPRDPSHSLCVAMRMRGTDGSSYDHIGIT